MRETLWTLADGVDWDKAPFKLARSEDEFDSGRVLSGLKWGKQCFGLPLTTVAQLEWHGSGSETRSRAASWEAC